MLFITVDFSSSSNVVVYFACLLLTASAMFRIENENKANKKENETNFMAFAWLYFLSTNIAKEKLFCL
jgi:hypothetical protein